MADPFPLAPSLWAATAPPPPPTPPLDGSVSADICVIGGGYAGLSTALHLAERARAALPSGADQTVTAPSAEQGLSLGDHRLVPADRRRPEAGCLTTNARLQPGQPRRSVVRLTDFDVLTFDLIGTLIDFETGVLDFVRPRILIAHPGTTDTELLESYARAQSTIREREPGLLFSQRLPHIWAEMAAAYGARVAEQDATLFVQSARRWPAFPDAAAALVALKRYFRFLVVVTNGDRVSARAMAASLGSPFSEIITEEDMGVAKPDPRAFEYFIAHLERQGVNRSRILHVAQSQYHDIGIARRHGLATAWIYRRHGQVGYGGTQVPPEFTRPDFLAISLEALLRQYEAELGA